jgi:hypothetical protein
VTPFLGAVTIDWDGYQANHRWDPNAVIAVGDSNNLIRYYQTNHPPDPNDPNPVYEISCPKGDLNNDQAVTFEDIDPLVAALSSDPNDPNSPYALAFPGLSGSMIYHGNCDCDPNNTVDFDDVDAFVLRLLDPNAYYAAYPGCEQCTGQDDMGQSQPNDPASIAAMFRTYVAPQRLAGFIAHAREFVRRHADTPRGRYWAAVLRELE